MYILIHTYTHTNMYSYPYTHTPTPQCLPCGYMCMQLQSQLESAHGKLAQEHSHLYSAVRAYIYYIYIYVCVCVRVRVSMYGCIFVHVFCSYITVHIACALHIHTLTTNFHASKISNKRTYYIHYDIWTKDMHTYTCVHYIMSMSVAFPYVSSLPPPLF
ncbi:hypothetical protein EON63_17335 [archaeon]|nr:MAG: hypothetical protein EON63_17335 [archaeon]